MIEESGKAKTKVDLMRDEILHQITIGNFSRGTVLPSERELSSHLGVSYMTTRKAIGQLVGQKYLERIPGVGTFVLNNICESKLQKTLGVILPAWAAVENVDFIMYVTEAAERESMILRLYFARSWEDRAVTDAWNNSDALILMAPEPVGCMHDVLREKFLCRQKPVIFCGTPAHHFGFDTVMGVPEMEATMVMDKLLEAGHTRIAFIDQYLYKNDSLTPSDPTFHNIWQDRMSSKNSYDIVQRLNLIANAPRFRMPHQAAYDTLCKLGTSIEYTAICCPLSLAWGVVAALNDSGLKIPEDVSLVTIGDRQEIPFYRPRLSYVKVSLQEHVNKAIEAMKKRETHPDLPPQYLIVSPVFVEGETLKPI